MPTVLSFTERRLVLLGLWSLLACSLIGTGCNEPTDARLPATTTPAGAAGVVGGDKFRFHYDVTIKDLTPGKIARVWVPVAQSNHDQDVTLGEIVVPGEHSLTEETKFGNQLIYFEAAADDSGQIPVQVTYEISRKELTAATGEPVADGETGQFLAPSSLVPVGNELLCQVVGEKKPDGDGNQVAGELYNAVYTWMDYGKPKDKMWGRGDAVYACDEKVGNCTDFHSLFISMCRTLKMPAKFEIGFMIAPEGKSGDVGGYHCWAKFADRGRWVGVDISEADKDATKKDYYFGSLTPNRVTFTTGRDLALQPEPANKAVNFLVYPYVEVDGEQQTAIEKQFRFERIE